MRSTLPECKLITQDRQRKALWDLKFYTLRFWLLLWVNTQGHSRTRKYWRRWVETSRNTIYLFRCLGGLLRLFQSNCPYFVGRVHASVEWIVREGLNEANEEMVLGMGAPKQTHNSKMPGLRAILKRTIDHAQNIWLVPSRYISRRKQSDTSAERANTYILRSLRQIR